MNKKIGFIGGGKMAQAIISGIIKANFFNNNEIFVSEPNPDCAEKIKKEFNLNICSSNQDLVKNSDIIVFAVKPFIIDDIISEIKSEIQENKLIITILAGISSTYIQKELGVNIPIIRVMPNTPALVNAGMSALAKGDFATDEDIVFAKELFECLGKAIIVDEDKINIITAISGSSPAFFYYFIDEMAKSAEKMGLDYNMALLACAQSALGSAKMIMETGISPTTLIDNVTTKGGTTEVGMNILKENNVDKIIDKAIIGTKEKASALGK